jgi:hypothetical protein
MTRTLDRRPEIGLDSFDWFFPNQDTLPRGGFGSLIALPLQKAAREKSHSIFLNNITAGRSALIFWENYGMIKRRPPGRYLPIRPGFFQLQPLLEKP